MTFFIYFFCQPISGRHKAQGTSVRVFRGTEAGSMAANIASNLIDEPFQEKRYAGMTMMSDPLVNGSGEEMTHEQFLDRVHWSYGETGGGKGVAKWKAWALEHNSEHHGNEENIFDQCAATVNGKTKYKSYFLGKDVAIESYAEFYKIRAEDGGIDLSKFYASSGPGARKQVLSDLKSYFKENIDASTGRSKTPFSSGFSNNILIMWKASLAGAKISGNGDLVLSIKFKTIMGTKGVRCPPSLEPNQADL